MTEDPQISEFRPVERPNWLLDAVFVTGNRQKVIEARRLCGVDLASAEVDLPEIQSLDILEVLNHKADEAIRHVTGPFPITTACHRSG